MERMGDSVAMGAAGFRRQNASIVRAQVLVARSLDQLVFPGLVPAHLLDPLPDLLLERGRWETCWRNPCSRLDECIQFEPQAMMLGQQLMDGMLQVRRLTEDLAHISALLLEEEVTEQAGLQVPKVIRECGGSDRGGPVRSLLHMGKLTEEQGMLILEFGSKRGSGLRHGKAP